ncbi:MAG TPA: LysR substrate-binding domain-containing protein [Chloroflexota bacterium]|nr:LysR substrate-binding domain-containing protein [Chloroflexota bacterium]
MELHHLRAFIAVAEELHFGRAAARLHVSQPPLSQQIQRLERELGARLFDRTRRSVKLTPAGEVLLQEARGIVDEVEHAREAVQRASSGAAGRLRIAFVGAAAYEALPRCVRTFRRHYPDVAISTRESVPSSEQVSQLLEGSLDIGFIGTPPRRHEELDYEVVDQEWLVAVLPDSHPAAAGDSVEFTALAGEPFIIMSRSRSTSLYDSLLAACHRAGFNPRLAYEVSEMPAAVGLAAAGLGVAIMPSSVCRICVPGVIYRRLEPRVTRDVVLACRRESPLPVVRNFVRLVRTPSF